jgi:hypothetical protein
VGIVVVLWAILILIPARRLPIRATVMAAAAGGLVIGFELIWARVLSLLPGRTSARYIGMRASIRIAAIAVMAISCTQSVASVAFVHDGATSLVIQQYGGSSISLLLAYWHRFTSAIHQKSASLHMSSTRSRHSRAAQ